MGGAGALGGGLLGARTMLDKTFEDYKADRLAWSQRKQRAREQGLNTREMDRERPKWVLPYLKAALRGGLVGGTVGGVGGGLGGYTGVKLMQAAVGPAAEKGRERTREKLDRILAKHGAKKTSSIAASVEIGCFDYVRNLYAKEAGITDSLSRGAVSLRDSLQDKENLKRLLRASLLGAGGMAVGGAAGSLLKTKGGRYDRYGRPKRQSRAGLGALLGGSAGATVGLLANPKLPYENTVTG